MTNNYISATYDKPPHGRLNIKSWVEGTNLNVFVWCETTKNEQAFAITTLPEDKQIALLECIRKILEVMMETKE